jgi:hypothetical protein
MLSVVKSRHPNAGAKTEYAKPDLDMVVATAVFTCQKHRDNTRHPMDSPQHLH